MDQVGELLDPRLSSGVIAVEKVLDQPLVAVFLEEQLEGARGFAGIVAGRDHVFEPDHIGFALGAPAVAAEGGLHAVFIGEVKDPRRQGNLATRRCRLSRELTKKLGVVVALDATDDMAFGDVRDFMTQHHRELRLIVEPGQQAGVHVEGAAPEGKGVDVGVPHDADAVSEGPRVRDGREALDDVAEIGVQQRVVPDLVRVLELPRVLLRHLLFIGLGELGAIENGAADSDAALDHAIRAGRHLAHEVFTSGEERGHPRALHKKNQEWSEQG